MRLHLIIIIALLTVASARASEPRFDYIDSIGTVSDTVISFKPVPAAASAAIEVRYSLPRNRRSASSVRLTWQGGQWSAWLTRCHEMADDIIDTREDVLTVCHGDSVVSRSTVKGIDGDLRGSCTFVVELTTSGATFLAGDRTLTRIGELTRTFDLQQSLGIKVTGTADIEVAVLESRENPAAALATRHTDLAALKALCHGAQPPVGVWKFLDRDTDSRQALAGGRYTLAVVPTENPGNFDIIYIDGAEVNADSWRTGMKKGELRPTIFTGHYDLVWYDSRMEPIVNDASASIEQGAILTLSFPLLKSSLRFSLQR